MPFIKNADGPTSIFLAGSLNMSWLNLFGLILIILLLIPNIIYAIKYKNQINKCTNTTMNILEQVGRYGCMFLMIFNIGILEFGFSSVTMLLIYLIGSLALIVSYWICWMIFFVKPAFRIQIALAIIPTLLFLLSGITSRNYLLIIFAILFGIGHIYVTAQNGE